MSFNLFAAAPAPRPATVDQAIGALTKSLDDLAHVADSHETHAELHVTQAEEHAKVALASQAEATRARNIHAKISALVA